jgi:predicted O-linked N-acetylglucosamine transferase (SPINDLY family)
MNEKYPAALNLLNAGRLQEARQAYLRLLESRRDVKFILNDLGVTYFLQDEYARAVAYYDAALLIDGQFAIAHQNRGNALARQNRIDEAIASFYRAMDCRADKAWCTQVGQQILLKLAELGRNEDIETYWQYLHRRFPDDSGILHNLANHIQGYRYAYGEAIEIYRKIENHPQLERFTLLNDWAVALKGQGLLSQARQKQLEALNLQPFQPLIYSNYLFDMLYEPELDAGWILNQHKRYETTQVIDGTVPFIHHPEGEDPGRPLRIGYLSADLRYHSIGVFALSAFKNHDSRQFQVYAYYNCSHSDNWTQQFKKHAFVWCELKGAHPTAVAQQIHADRIDILVDINGHTMGNLLPALLYKPAPIQISWLGHVHSLGISKVDYFITDATADPPGMTEDHFVEKLLRLPESFLCFTPYNNPPELLDTPALAAGFVTLGLVGNFAKLNPYMIGLYAQILQLIPKSRCLIKSAAVQDPEACGRLMEMFAAVGIASDRLILQKRTNDPEAYLQGFREIDILLDFYPFNGETITCAALQMGTPVVSLAGKSHRSRAGLSILTALGHPEWASPTPAGFVETAAFLAADVKKLNVIHLQLRDEFLSSPLCNGPSFTRNLEAAYRRIWKDYLQGDAAGGRKTVLSEEAK